MANKPAQLLIIEPANELKFIGPFNTAVSSFMRLTNPTEHKILFKIKTTAPKKYCVRPNCGLLEPRNTMEITIVLQPFNFDAAEKNKHKFMVQSMILPERPGETSVAQLWQEVSPDDLMDSKLRCVFELPADNNQVSATAVTATNITNTQAAIATPNTNEPSAPVMESQHGISVSSDEDKMTETALLQELKKLREAESSLRQENLGLKERVLRMRLELESKEQQSASSASGGLLGSLVSGGTSASGAASATQYQNPYSPPQLATQQQIPILYVAVAIAMAVFGLVIGKFIL